MKLNFGDGYNHGGEPIAHRPINLIVWLIHQNDVDESCKF